jgi:hypothetical protein
MDFNLIAAIGSRSTFAINRKLLVLALHTLSGFCSDAEYNAAVQLFALQCAVYQPHISSAQLQELRTAAHHFCNLLLSIDARTFDVSNVHALSELICRDLPTFGSVIPLRMQSMEASHKLIKREIPNTNQRESIKQVMNRLRNRYALQYMMNGGAWGSKWQYRASPDLLRYFAARYGPKLVYERWVRHL